MGSILTDEQCWPTYSEGCGQDCIAFHPYRELDEFMVCHNDTRARTQADENVVTWFDDDTEVQNLGPHSGPVPTIPYGRLKSARDDGRNDIRPGIHEGANPLWSKNGETPNPASAQPKPPEEQSKAQKEVKERTAAAAAAAQQESAARQKEAERIENESKQAAGCQP